LKDYADLLFFHTLQKIIEANIKTLISFHILAKLILIFSAPWQLIFFTYFAQYFSNVLPFLNFSLL